MKKPLFIAVLAAACSLLASETKTVSLADLPVAAQNAVKAQAGAEKVGDIEREDDDGDVTFTVEVIVDGKSRTFSVNADGVLVSMEIALEEMPVAVLKTIHAQIGQGKLESVEKTFGHGQVAYDVEMVNETLENFRRKYREAGRFRRA